MPIPKIIHQIWLGNKPIPIQLINILRQFHPQFEYRLWREHDIEQHKHLWKCYRQYASVIGDAYNVKSDIMRYEIVQYFGGYYFDVDFIFKKSLGNFFDNFAFVVCKENHITYGDKIYCNALFASVPFTIHSSTIFPILH